MSVTSIAASYASSAGSATGLSAEQNSIINQAKNAGVDSKQIAGMVMQCQMDNLKNMNDMMSNLLKKLGEMAQTIISNIR